VNLKSIISIINNTEGETVYSLVYRKVYRKCRFVLLFLMNAISQKKEWKILTRNLSFIHS